jgi:hypothetical protein
VSARGEGQAVDVGGPFQAASQFVQSGVHFMKRSNKKMTNMFLCHFPYVLHFCDEGVSLQCRSMLLSFCNPIFSPA